MNKYAEMRCWIYDEVKQKYYMSATTKDNRWGEHIRIVEADSVNKTIKFLDEDAKTDKMVRKIIDELLEDEYVLTE